jgi:hypothetical protein
MAKRIKINIFDHMRKALRDAAAYASTLAEASVISGKPSDNLSLAHPHARIVLIRQ